MAENSAGRVLLIPKGVFTIGTNYTPLDFVAFGSNNYVCKKATDGTKTPVEDTASWQMLAEGFDSHNIAAEYSEEAIYHAGDICISGGNLYKAKQDINAAETFTAGHWEEITVGQELTSIETTKADASDVTTLKEKVGTAALTTTATDLSGAVNEVKAATDTNASSITQLNSDLGKIYRKTLFDDKISTSSTSYTPLDRINDFDFFMVSCIGSDTIVRGSLYIPIGIIEGGAQSLVPCIRGGMIKAASIEEDRNGNFVLFSDDLAYCSTMIIYGFKVIK